MDGRTEKKKGRFADVTVGILLAVLVTGCDRGGEKTGTGPPALSEEALGAFVIDDAAPTVADRHPGLASSALQRARLMDLPDGVLLRSEAVTIQQADLERELAGAPVAMRDELRGQAFFLLEQMAARELLAAEARAADLPGRHDEDRIQALLERESRELRVTDEEAHAFFEANREMTGGMSYERIAPQIRQHLLQEKQQERVEAFIGGLAERAPVAVSTGWTAQQAAAAKDNPIERARASGKPTMVSFGADKCMPCRAMAPAREAVAGKYEGRANVVYIPVDQYQVLSSRYGVRGIPHLVFYDAEGREVYARTGMMSQDEMEAQFTRLGAGG